MLREKCTHYTASSDFCRLPEANPCALKTLLSPRSSLKGRGLAWEMGPSMKNDIQRDMMTGWRQERMLGKEVSWEPLAVSVE